MRRFLYSCLFYLALPGIYLRLLWRSRRLPAYRHHLAQRLSFRLGLSVMRESIWVHAVSAGEALAAGPLVEKMRQRYPDLPVVMTATTPTGRQAIRRRFGDTVPCTYAPYDIPFAVHRFLDKTRPRLAVFMETELWPNYLHALQSRHIPVMLANARLSARSARRYRRWSCLTADLFNKIDRAAVQSRADGKRFVALGLSADRMTVVGNIKFDLQIPLELAMQARDLKVRLGANRQVWIAASTHAGEEEQVLSAFARVKAKIPDALLLLVPRHPDRFAAVADLCRRRYRTVLRSEKQVCTPEDAVFVGDSMGELLLFYAVADVAFVGGSLIERGGHNMLEAAAFAVPIISGRHIFNFPHVAALLRRADALTLVDDAAALATAVIDLLRDEEKRMTRGTRAKRVLEQNRGALARHLRLVEDLLA